jgi:VWFA-related protein
MLRAFTAAFLGLFAFQAFAQEATIKVDVDLVSLFFSVRDKQGRYLKDLEKDAFTVFEDGKQQEVRYFSREVNLPLTIGLLIDVSKSQENLIDIERRAGGEFFSSVMRNKDMAFLISFGSEAELLQDLTGSQKLLQKGLGDLRLNASVGGLHPSSTGSKQRGTIMYDAVYLAANEKLKGEVGRKAIVLITDGMDFGSRVSLQEAISAAHKSDAIIYSIYYVDPRMYGWGGYSDGDLKKMSEETGGRLFHVDRKNTLDSIFRQIQEEMRSQYAIGYSSTNGAKDGQFRKVEIRPSAKDLKVQARKGYYAARN